MSIRTAAARTTLAAALAVSAGLGLAACGSSDDNGVAPAAATSSTSRPDPVATVPAVTGGSTAVALDAGFTDALTSLGLTPGTVGTATLTGGSISFPITGGTVTVYDKASGYRPWVQGVLFHEGSGLSLTAGGTTVELSDFTIDPGKPARLFGNVTVNGQLAAPSAPLFDLNGKDLGAPTQDANGNTVLQGTQVKISPEAAALLDSTFKTDAVKGGLLVGTSTISVQTK
ncbi:hypothetical protein [Modestobacter sp. NPDC049651]|uniref:hypothetical protein n=1 Tax=Modestobacter sp. NPDC049651 TaxID=3155777 RepID=UPI0034087529